MIRRAFLASTALAAGTLVLGCAPPWKVIIEEPRNPFQNQRRFAVMELDFAGLEIGDNPEMGWLEEKDAQQRASFADDKVAMSARFATGLGRAAADRGIMIVKATGPNDAPFLIRGNVRFIEPGFFVGVASKPSRTEMDVRIMAPDGRILNQILIHHATRGGFGPEASIGGRLRRDAEVLGEIVARYLETRVREPGG